MTIDARALSASRPLWPRLLVAATRPSAAPNAATRPPGFDAWVQQFKARSGQQRHQPSVLDRSFPASTTTCPRSAPTAARKASSCRLTTSCASVARQPSSRAGEAMKSSNRALFATHRTALRRPAGPLIAIWGMETGFGGFMGNQHTLSAVSTLAYDCRRTEYFTDQLYAALKLVQNGTLADQCARCCPWRNRPDPVPAEKRAALRRRRRW